MFFIPPDRLLYNTISGNRSFLNIHTFELVPSPCGARLRTHTNAYTVNKDIYLIEILLEKLDDVSLNSLCKCWCSDEHQKAKEQLEEQLSTMAE